MCIVDAAKKVSRDEARNGLGLIGELGSRALNDESFTACSNEYADESLMEMLKTKQSLDLAQNPLDAVGSSENSLDTSLGVKLDLGPEPGFRNLSIWARRSSPSVSVTGSPGQC
jgi:hypothetical protein